MSTPTSTLPLKTDRTSPDQSDINDPIVQDVLNEFREELMSSKNNEDNKQPQQQQLQQQQMYQQQMQNQQMQQQQMQQQQMQQQQIQQQQMQQQNNDTNKIVLSEKNENFPYFNIEFDVIKKSLVIVILSILIYNTGLINTLYEKLPEYLQENLNVFDIYIKSFSLFVILYTLILFQYV